jgi:hypothetical protein
MPSCDLHLAEETGDQRGKMQDAEMASNFKPRSAHAQGRPDNGRPRLTFAGCISAGAAGRPNSEAKDDYATPGWSVPSYQWDCAGHSTAACYLDLRAPGRCLCLWPRPRVRKAPLVTRFSRNICSRCQTCDTTAGGRPSRQGTEHARCRGDARLQPSRARPGTRASPLGAITTLSEPRYVRAACPPRDIGGPGPEMRVSVPLFLPFRLFGWCFCGIAFRALPPATGDLTA